MRRPKQTESVSARPSFIYENVSYSALFHFGGGNFDSLCSVILMLLSHMLAVLAEVLV